MLNTSEGYLTVWRQGHLTLFGWLWLVLICCEKKVPRLACRPSRSCSTDDRYIRFPTDCDCSVFHNRAARLRNVSEALCNHLKACSIVAFSTTGEGIAIEMRVRLCADPHDRNKSKSHDRAAAAAHICHEHAGWAATTATSTTRTCRAYRLVAGRPLRHAIGNLAEVASLCDDYPDRDRLRMLIPCRSIVEPDGTIRTRAWRWCHLLLLILFQLDSAKRNRGKSAMLPGKLLVEIKWKWIAMLVAHCLTNAHCASWNEMSLSENVSTN